MTLPTAVASGVDVKAEDGFVPVRSRRAGVIAGLLAALYLVVIYTSQPVPGKFVRVVGGRGDAVGRYGGVRLVWEPPPGIDPARVEDMLAARDASVRREGTRFTIEIGDVAAEDAHALVLDFTQKPLEFHEVLETEAMASVIRVLGLPMKDAQPLDGDIDQWKPEEGGATHTDYYLRAQTREQLEQAFAKARALGWSLPPHARLAYQQISAEGTSSWRSYVVSDEAGLDGNDVSNATGTFDPNTNRPVVLLELTRAGGAKFGELTARIAGKKLATMTGDEVKSAPIINGPIRGGRAQITMGGGDARQQEHERDLLVKVLRAGTLPIGGTLISENVIAPSDTALQMWLGRLLLAVLGGALIGLLTWIVVRVTRPVRLRAAAAASGPWRVSRIFVTLLAPVAVLGLSYAPVPTVDADALEHALGPTAHTVINLGAVGITPLLMAYVVAELLAVSVWRKRRHGGPVARRPITHAFVVVAIVLTTLQAWTLTTYLQGFPLDDILPQTSQARVEVVLAFGLATAVLAAVAAVIRCYGLGNGYGALIVSSWLILAVRAGIHLPTAAYAVLLVQSLAIAIPVVVVLRWRVYRIGEAMLRVPTSGVLPIVRGAGLVFVAGLLAFAGGGSFTSHLYDAIAAMRGDDIAGLGLMAVLVVVWSAAFAWPRAIPAERAGLRPPSWSSWVRATGLSLALLGALVAVLAPGTKAPVFVDAVWMAMVTATLLDAFGELRARRAVLDHVWTVHSAQRAELVERQLRDAGIPCHLAAANLRTILGGFGAFAPIDVLVPPEHAPAARALLTTAPTLQNSEP